MRDQYLWLSLKRSRQRQKTRTTAVVAGNNR
jgi:hypothetical protein